MIVEILTLNDGTELNGYAEENNGKLSVHIHEKTMREVFELLSEKTKTSKIISEKNGDTCIFKNYTHMYSITEAFQGLVITTMTKE